jgi:hypothetical protein
MARSLQEAGYPLETTIILRRDDQIALRSTVGKAATLVVTTSKTGTPIFARYRDKGKSQPLTCVTGREAIPSASIANNEPANPALYLSSPSTAAAQDAPANEHEPSSENHR